MEHSCHFTEPRSQDYVGPEESREGVHGRLNANLT